MEASVAGYDFLLPRVAGCVWSRACFVFQGYPWCAQGVTCAVPPKRRVTFTTGLEHEVFIYFALTFLKEAFQGLLYTGFPEFTAWAELLSVRSANTLITTFQLPKPLEFALFSETMNRMLLQLCFPGMRKPFLDPRGRIRKFTFCPCSPGLLSAQRQPEHVAVPSHGCGGCWKVFCFQQVSACLFMSSFLKLCLGSHSNAGLFSKVTKGSCTLWCCHPCIYYKKKKKPKKMYKSCLYSLLSIYCHWPLVRGGLSRNTQR